MPHWPGEGPEREALQRLAVERRLKDRVKFLGWRTDRASLFKTADFCVFPSREEPFGNVVVEAWARGTPSSCGPYYVTRY